MESKETFNNNKNNFPVNIVEQKETKNLYLSKKGSIKKENQIKKIEKEEEKQEIQDKEEEIHQEEDEKVDNKNKEEQNNEENKEEDNNEEKEEEENNVEKEEAEIKEEELKEKEKENGDNNKINDNKDNNTFNINDDKISKELKLKFNDIIKGEYELPDKLPVIKSGSYLTELPSEAYYNKKKNKTFKKSKYKESSKVINYLKEKELSLNKEISNLKDKKEKLMNISFSNMGLSDIEKNRNNYEKKKLQTIENNLMDKLNEVKFQIKGIIQREKLLKNSKSTLIQNFIKRYENEETSNFKKYIKNNRKLILDSNKENKIEEKKEELIEIKKEKTEEEKKLDKRREKIKEEVLKLEKNPIPKNYLFFKMANSFEEQEKLFYKNIKQIKKSELAGKEELKQLYQQYKEKQKQLKEKANEKTLEMKKEWRCNSLKLKRYHSPLSSVMQKSLESERKKKLEEENELNKKKQSYLNKNNLKIPLPKISTKLRKENLKQNFSLNDLHGRERVKHIKEEVDQIKESLKKNYDIGNKRYKQSNILNKHKKLEMKIVNKIQSKTLNKIEKKNKKEIKAINYLEDSKRNSNKNIIWDKYLYDEDNKVTNIRNIKGQIEGLDNSAEMKKEIIRINGGFFNNQKLGSELSNILINSINGKISVINAINYSN